jgi:hypothetical protein
MKRRAVATVLASAVLSACGSTVQVRGTAALDGDGVTQQSGGTSTGGLGSTGSTSTGGTGGSSSAGGTGATNQPGSATPASANPGTVITVTTGGSTTSSGATGSSIRGDRTPIEVGILLFPDLDKAAQAFGDAVDTGNQTLITDTAVRWINTHGGVAGHPIKVIKHNVSLTSSETYDQIMQQACEDFTVDHKVAVAIAPATAANNNFAACLKKAGVQLLMSGHWMHDSQDWRQYPNLWSANEPDMGSVAKAMVDQVLNRSLAKPGGKVGLMTMTHPAGVRAANNVIKPKLKAAGIEVVEYTVPPPASTADSSNSVAVINSAELRMASEQIQTVLFLCPACLSFFARQANTQQYYPRYLSSSLDTPINIKDSEYSRSMRDAIMIGWQPDLDVGLYRHPKELADNGTRKLCHTMMDPIKQSRGDVSEFATQVICDSFLQVKKAAELNPVTPLNGPAFGVGMGRIGTGFPCALNYTTNLTPGHHGGVTSYRTMHWDSSKLAFVYDSPKRLSFR